MQTFTRNGPAGQAQTAPHTTPHTTPPAPSLPRRVQLLVKSRLIALIGMFPPRPTAPFRLRLKEAGIEVLFRVQPDDWTRTHRLPGKHLSPAEHEVWDALATGPLIGKQLAKKLGRSYNPVLRFLLANLIKRGVLVRDPCGRGYARGGHWGMPETTP